MNNLPKSLIQKANKYGSLDKSETHSLLNTLYNEYELSWITISELCGTYPNKIRRDAKALGISSRDKKQAQKLALKHDRQKHPTKGIGHSSESKVKISNSVANNWSNKSEKELEEFAKQSKERWEKRSKKDLDEMRRSANEAIRKAAKEGSALEKYIMGGLAKNNHRAEFHKEQWVIRQNLQIDIYIPKMNIAIEIDGPSHFKEIWGKEVLQKNKNRDTEKNGLLLQSGCVIIRVKQEKSLSQKFKRDTMNSILTVLDIIKQDRSKFTIIHINGENIEYK